MEVSDQPVTHKTKLGVFFSHPTQHQSVMFQALSRQPQLDVRVYYYDPGSLGNMFDAGYGTRQPWDIDLLSGTKSVVLRNWLRDDHVNVFRQLNPSILRTMAREHFDAVFVAGYISLSNWLVLWMARRSHAHVLYFSDTNILNERRQVPGWLKFNIRKLFLDRVDTFLTIGDHNREVYLDLGYPASRMVWCPYPVDVKRYRMAQSDSGLDAKLAELRQKYDIPPEARIVAQCGKLIARKRPYDFIDAVRKMQADNVIGLLIGSGPMEAELRQQLTHRDRIRITGFVNQQLIPYHMLLADVGVISSDFDPHPLVTTEFAACGKPIVASHYCGVWGPNDILRPRENGYVYTCGHTDELAQSLDRLLTNDQLRLCMGQRSLELAEEQSADYSALQITTRLRLVSERVLGSQTLRS